METLWGVLAYALIPAAAVVLGGTVAAFRPPGARLRSAVQHLAAGVVFAAVAIELLPDILHEGRAAPALGGFALGVGLMLGIKQWTQGGRQQGAGTAEPPISLMWTLGVDLLVDGLLVGVGFAAGAKEGLLLTLALTTEALFLGLSGASALTKAGASRAKVIVSAAGFAAVLLAGAALGGTLLAGLSGAALEAVLSFGAAALLYLVTEELLVEAHEEPETPLLAATFFVGFVLLLLAEMANSPAAGR